MARMTASFERQIKEILDKYTKKVQERVGATDKERLVAGYDVLQLDDINDELLAALDSVGYDIIGAANKKEVEEIFLGGFTVENPYYNKYTPYAGELVVNISQEIKQTISALINQGFENKETISDIADSIKKNIGLAKNQAVASAKYYNKLREQGHTKKRARELADRYVNRQLKRRAENIARTETARASTMGIMHSWDIGEERGFVLPEAQKRWITANDERTCPICGPLHNETVPRGTDFPGGYDAPPAHPSCRCSVSLYTPTAGRAAPKKLSQNSLKRLREENIKHNKKLAEKRRRLLARGTSRKS